MSGVIDPNDPITASMSFEQIALTLLAREKSVRIYIGGSR